MLILLLVLVLQLIFDSLYSAETFFQNFRNTFSKRFSYRIFTRAGKFTTRLKYFETLCLLATSEAKLDYYQKELNIGVNT